MLIRLLGPISVMAGESARPVPGLRRRATLAVLALQPGTVVGTDQLIDVVWGGRPPATALNTLQSHISHLRRLLGEGASIVARPPGYLLQPATDLTDVTVAEGLIRRGAAATSLPQRVADLRTALCLWRGRALADITGLPWLDEQAGRLELVRLAATRSLHDARLELGEHAELLAELEHLSRQHPLDEHLHEQLLLALYRSGRQSDALRVYQALRRTLDEELGIEPGPALRKLHTALLRQDAGLDSVTPPASRPPMVVPALLPAGVHAFAGRDTELARLDDLLTPVARAPADGAATTVVISAVSGTAGVGKTALAVHWAHRVAARFPDGQLYVDLRGFDQTGASTDPAVAVRGFLEALGVPVQRLPADPAQQVNLYRSVLAGKRVLLVLDNARDAEQVRPLLPGAAGCLVLITSRHQLIPLMATEGARPLMIDLLPVDQARDLLARRLGADRLRREPGAADDIIERCARLPLALGITAARAALHPGTPLSTFAAELRDAAEALDVLQGGDATTDVRAVFSWSYRALSPAAARLFRLLGLHPGPDVTTAAAASLAGITPARARALVGELTRHHLLTERMVGRYSFHDLLRAHAVEQAHAVDGAVQRDAALHRMLEHYLRTAQAAARLISAIDLALDDAVPPWPGVTAETLVDYEGATAWLTAERPVLLAAAEQAAGTGRAAYTWRLAHAMTAFLQRSCRWHDQAAVQRLALVCAQRAGYEPGQAHAHRGLGLAFAGMAHLDDAVDHYLRALSLFDAVGDPQGRALTHQSLAWALGAQQRYREAAEHSSRSLEIRRAAGDKAGQASALNSVGWYLSQLGELDEAVRHCTVALTLFEALGDQPGQAHTLDSIGYIHLRRGDHERAVGSYARALELFTIVGEDFSAAVCLSYLGDTHAAACRPADARAAWQRAVDIFQALGHPNADDIRKRLRGLAA